MIQVDVAEDYSNLARKTLAFMRWASDEGFEFQYFMHADDDSFIRLDLLLESLDVLPRERLYWGYIWDNMDKRITRPIRDPKAKSYMPFEQYQEDHYPPFASGCGFVISSDLVCHLVAHSHHLPDYRLVDVAFGVYLHSVPDKHIIHEDRVRPYRPLPLFRADTIIQHYLSPEEFSPFYKRAISSQSRCGVQQGPEDQRIQQFYEEMVRLGLGRFQIQSLGNK